MDGAIRRHVDARLVSYALSVLSEKEIAPELQVVLQACTTAAIQAACGLSALTIACRTAAESPVLAKKFDARQREHVQSLFEGLAATVDESWKADLKELFEVIVVLTCDSMSDPEMESYFRQWAQGTFLDTRPLVVLEDDVQADIEVEDDPEPKRNRVRKPRSSKLAYQQERLENLVARAIALGINSMTPVMSTGVILVVGKTDKGREEKLLKVRGSMSEAKELCAAANEEIRRMDAVQSAL